MAYPLTSGLKAFQRLAAGMGQPVGGTPPMQPPRLSLPSPYGAPAVVAPTAGRAAPADLPLTPPDMAPQMGPTRAAAARLPQGGGARPAAAQPTNQPQAMPVLDPGIMRDLPLTPPDGRARNERGDFWDALMAGGAMMAKTGATPGATGLSSIGGGFATAMQSLDASASQRAQAEREAYDQQWSSLKERVDLAKSIRDLNAPPLQGKAQDTIEVGGKVLQWNPQTSRYDIEVGPAAQGERRPYTERGQIIADRRAGYLSEEEAQAELARLEADGAPQDTALVRNARYLVEVGLAGDEAQAVRILQRGKEDPTARARLIQAEAERISESLEGMEMSADQVYQQATQRIDALLRTTPQQPARPADPNRPRDASGAPQAATPQPAAPGGEADAAPLTRDQLDSVAAYTGTEPPPSYPDARQAPDGRWYVRQGEGWAVVMDEEAAAAETYQDRSIAR